MTDEALIPIRGQSEAELVWEPHMSVSRPLGGYLCQGCPSRASMTVVIDSPRGIGTLLKLCDGCARALRRALALMLRSEVEK